MNITGTAHFDDFSSSGYAMWRLTACSDPDLVGSRWAMTKADHRRAIHAAGLAHTGTIEVEIGCADDQFCRPAWEGWAE